MPVDCPFAVLLSAAENQGETMKGGYCKVIISIASDLERMGLQRVDTLCKGNIREQPDRQAT